MRWKDGSVSVATAAAQLGVPSSAVWHLIVEGRLQAYADRRGNRVFTRVLLAARPDADCDEHSTPLTAQVERLTTTIERLTVMLRSARCEAATVEAAGGSDGRPRRRVRGRPAPQTATPEVPPLEFFLKAAGPPQALRPNPMTHPVEVLPPPRADSRDDLLEPVRQLFEQHQRQWWQRLPLVSRG